MSNASMVIMFLAVFYGMLFAIFSIACPQPEEFRAYCKEQRKRSFFSFLELTIEFIVELYGIILDVKHFVVYVTLPIVIYIKRRKAHKAMRHLYVFGYHPER